MKDSGFGIGAGAGFSARSKKRSQSCLAEGRAIVPGRLDDEVRGLKIVRTISALGLLLSFVVHTLHLPPDAAIAAALRQAARSGESPAVAGVSPTSGPSGAVRSTTLIEPEMRAVARLARVLEVMTMFPLTKKPAPPPQPVKPVSQGEATPKIPVTTPARPSTPAPPPA